MVIYKSRSVRLKKKKPLVLKIEGYGKNCGPFRESITREARPSLGVLTQIRERNVSKTFYASVVDDTAASYWEVWGCKSILFRCELCPTESGPVEYHPACATVGSSPDPLPWKSCTCRRRQGRLSTWETTTPWKMGQCWLCLGNGKRAYQKKFRELFFLYMWFLGYTSWGILSKV